MISVSFPAFSRSPQYNSMVEQNKQQNIDQKQMQNSKPRHKLRRIPFVDQQLSSIIQRQKFTLDKLVKQNSDSKNLIDKLMEQGTGKTKFMISSQKELLELENELRKITIRLDTESKRNEVLKELVSILNNEDKKSKKEEFLEINRMVDQKEKKLKKQEYDIEQILQRHNEVIAKINVLKEQISSSRRERVVYSNLFKKIEKQIKVYEESYKEILMEAHEYEKKQKVIREEMWSKKKSERPPLNEVDEEDNEEDEQMEFMPSRKPIDIESIHIENSAPPSIPRRNPNMHKTTAMMETLNQFKIFFDILKSETGEESIGDVITVLPQYGFENEELLSKIQLTENFIMEQSEMLKELEGGINEAQYTYDTVQSTCLEEDQASIIQNQINQKSLEIESLSNILSDIGALLNIPTDETQIKVIFQMIENKLENLNPEDRKSSAQSEALLSKKLGENQTHIQSVIEKMDAYNQSQKILSKHYLQTQSIRELSKHKRLTKSRK